MGTEVTRWLAAPLALVLSSAAPAMAAERYALIVTGAPGGPELGATYKGWEQQLINALRDRLGFPADHIELLSGASDDPEQTSTRLHVQRAFEHLKMHLHADDLLFVVLIGHGTLDGGAAKFNLPGPDLTSVEWGALVRDLAGRLVFVDTTGGSFPFLADLASRRHIVITATDSVAQRYDTVFPGQFLAALTDPAADLDKNGRVSVWELFLYTSRAVARHFEQQGLLPTERPMLEDTGDGLGVEATDRTPSDGALARATYLERDRVEATGDTEMAALVTRQHVLEERAEQLRQKKSTMAPEAWERDYEQLMIELARVSHRIRAGS